MTASPTLIPFTDPRWTTLNTPSQPPTISKDGRELAFPTERESDWWRTPEVERASGLVYGFSLPRGKGFEVSVELDIEYKIQVGGISISKSDKMLSMPCL